MEKNTGILIVDDEKNILSSLKRLLQNEGYQIFIALSGMEGLEILKREKIGVVASDLMMPEMDGVTFLDKASEITPDAVLMLLTGHATLDNAVNAINRLGLFSFIIKPWKSEVIKSDFSRAFDKYNLVVDNKRLHDLTMEQNKKLAEWTETLEERVKIRTLLLEEAVGDTISILARIAESKDNTPEGHIYRVSNMVFELSKKLGLSDDDSERISQFSMLHDIGKVIVKDDILIKERDGIPLTSGELKHSRNHTILGEELLGVKPFYQIGRQIARSHHENWDGSGYPDGLALEEIPLAARIVAVVDMFDQLAYNKKYTKTTAVEALKTIRNLSGVNFDPSVVESFIRMKCSHLNHKRQSMGNTTIAVNA
jgi:response regulator RpfG family c-di-GMP phosphodiesterase